MQTVGLQTAIWNNNLRSLGLLLLFPVLVFVVLMLIAAIGIGFLGWHVILLDGDVGKIERSIDFIRLGLPPGFDVLMVRAAMVTVVLVLGWYLIAYFFHERLVDHFAHARPMERSEFPRAYNLLENLCISRGLPMPKLGVIEVGKMNAFASGLTPKTYRITLTQGLIEGLDDAELEAVLAHELTHIINRDVRLMVIAAIFTGILALLAEGFTRTATRPARRVYTYGRYAGNRRASGGQKVVGMILIAIVVWVGYMLSLLLRSMISRRREFMADAGAVQLTKQPEPMIRALRKISAKSHMAEFDDELRIMLFDNSKKFMGLFATHPTIDRRVETLQQQSRTEYDYQPPIASRRRHRALDGQHPNPWQVREMGMGTKARKRAKRATANVTRDYFDADGKVIMPKSKVSKAVDRR